MAPTKTTSLRLPADVLEWLKAQAEADQRSLAFIVSKVVREAKARAAKAKKRG